MSRTIRTSGHRRLIASTAICVIWLAIPYFISPLIVIPPEYDASLRALEVLLTIIVLFVVISDYRASRKQRARDYTTLLSVCREPVLIRVGERIISANQPALDLFSASVENQLIGRSILEFTHPDDRDTTTKVISDIELSTQVSEGQIVTLNNTVKDIRALGLPLGFGRKQAVLVVLRDITPDKQAEEQLRRTADLFQLIGTNLPEMIVCLDLNGTLKYESPSHAMYRRKFSCSPSGDSLADLVHPEDLKRIQSLYREIIANKQSMQTDIQTQSIRDTWVQVEVIGTPIINATTHEVEAVVLVSRDITKRKETEEFLRQTEKLTVVGQLAAGLAHEIRNPLTVIKGFVQLMGTSNFQQQHIELIMDELNRIESIISEFLVFSKPTTVTQQEVNLCETVENAVLLMSTQAAMRSVELKTELPSQSSFISCNVNHLRQVFMNLIRNAIESMQHGGQVRVQVNELDELVQVTIADEGEGMPESVIRHIGEPFFTTKSSGTGLGLMIAQRIVRQNHGSIEFKSTVGKGTTVEIRFPLLHPQRGIS